MNIYFRELKANFRSLLIWCGIMMLFVLIGTSKFEGYAQNPEILDMLKTMPPALLAAFNLNAFNLTTITGFYGVMFSYLSLVMTIAAVMWGSDIISKEERDKTVEFSLTLPVSRAKIVTAKAFAGLTNNILFLLITWGFCYLTSAKYEPDSAFYKFLFLIVVALFIFQFVFLAIGIFLGCVMKQHKRAGSTAVAILLGSYFISVITELHKNLEFLKYFSPFKYFNPGSLLRESKFEPTFVLLSFGIIIVCIVGAYVSYSRRDLYI